MEYHTRRVVFLTDINAFNSNAGLDNIVPAAGSPNAVVWGSMIDWAAGGDG